MPTVPERVDRYVDKLIAQYRTLPNARRTMAIMVKQVLMDDMPDQLLAAFALDLAVGPQLDVLGKYAGVSRYVGSSTPPGLFSVWKYASALLNANYQSKWNPATNTPTIPTAGGGNTGWWFVADSAGTSTAPIAHTWKAGDVIFSNGAVWAPSPNDTGNGLTTYADPAVNANGVFWSYGQASRAVSALTDDSYRTLIKLKIILNSSDGTLSAIIGALWTFFPNLIFLVDNKDMTLSYQVVSTVPLSVDVLKTFLPKPMGVGINVTIINPVPGTAGELTTEGGLVITTEDGTPITTETI